MAIIKLCSWQREFVLRAAKRQNRYVGEKRRATLNDPEEAQGRARDPRINDARLAKLEGSPQEPRVREGKLIQETFSTGGKGGGKETGGSQGTIKDPPRTS